MRRNMRIVAALLGCGLATAAVTAAAASGLPSGAAGLPLQTASNSHVEDTVASCPADKPVDAARPVEVTTTGSGGSAGSAASPASDDPTIVSPTDESTLAQGCTFFLVRHGQSHANVAGKIVSGMDGGVDAANGLTEKGLEQARKAGTELKEVLLRAGCSPANTIVLTSPFSRAKETAEAIRDCLDCELREESDLRERFFGDLDGGKDSNYEKVWALDAISSRHGELGVEPAAQVAARAAAVVSRARKEVSIRQRYYSGEEGQPFPPGPSAVILVSHGDTLAMLQCILGGRPVERHRSLLPHLENCGIRVLRPPPDEEAVAAAAVAAADTADSAGSAAPTASAAEGAAVPEGQDCGEKDEERGPGGTSGGGRSDRDGAGGGDGGGVASGRKGRSAGGGEGGRDGAGSFKMTGARVFRRPGKEGEGRGKQDVRGEAKEE